MGLLLDTGNIDSIKQFYRLGIIEGVTTNPTILRRSGIQDMRVHIKTICEIVHPYPVSVELTTRTFRDMIDEGTEITEWAHNIAIKVPIHPPQTVDSNAFDYLHVITHLSEWGVDVNATAMMSAQQGYLAALAGARYVSLFGGRVANMGHDPYTEITLLRHLLEQEGLQAEIIIGSVRETRNVIEWLTAGAHFVTVPPKFLFHMIYHPYSEKTVQQFLDDAEAMKCNTM